MYAHPENLNEKKVLELQKNGTQTEISPGLVQDMLEGLL